MTAEQYDLVQRRHHEVDQQQQAQMRDLTQDYPQMQRRVIPLEQLTIQARQRPFDQRKLKNMSGDLFDPEAVGVLQVVEMSDGRYHILDGQHRWEALKNKGYWAWVCDVHPIMPDDRIAELFAKVNNNRTNLTALTQHHAWSEAGRSGREHLQADAIMAREIDEAVEAEGFFIPESPQSNPRAVVAIDALQSLWRINGQDLIRATLAILRDGWGTSDERLQEGRGANFLRGIAHFYEYHREHGNFDRAYLVQTLQENGPRMVLSEARDITERFPKQRGYRAIYLALLKLYNKGRGPGRQLRRQDRSLFPAPDTGMRTLSDAKVEQIAREILDGASSRDIATRYNVVPSTVNAIRTGRRYSRVIDLAANGRL